MIWFGPNINLASTKRPGRGQSSVARSYVTSLSLLLKKDENHIPFSEPKFILDRREFAERNEQKLEVIGQYGDILDGLVERCKTFESHNGVRISVAGTRSWLLQFSVEDIPPAVRLLSAIRFWGRSALSDALGFSVGGRYPGGFQALGLGAPTSSAHHLTYLWDDVRDRVGSDFRVISAANEIQPDLPIVIYDDNVGSGGQAGTVFSQWFGITDADSDLAENMLIRSRQKTLPNCRAFRSSWCSPLAFARDWRKSSGGLSS